MKDHDLMQRLHDQGMSAAQIAAAVGCTVRTVSRWRRATGVAQPIPEHRWLPVPPERLAAAERLLDDGASYSEVERTLGIHHRTLLRHFPGRGWTSQMGGQLGAWVAQMNQQLESNTKRKAAA